jgi:hypothetical protein
VGKDLACCRSVLPVRHDSAFNGRGHHLFRAQWTPVGRALSGGVIPQEQWITLTHCKQSYPYKIAPS